jgi:hypothetical protein
MAQLRHNTATAPPFICSHHNKAQRAGNQERAMNFTAGKMAVAALAIGVTLGGCATRESVENAQSSADLADRHAGAAQARADEAYGVGNNALGVGNNALSIGHSAMSTAQAANARAAANEAEVNRLKRKVAYLEWKVLPHHSKKKVVHHHHTAQSAPPGDQAKPMYVPKSDNS